MSRKRVTIIEINQLIATANKLGADIQIPNPDDRPLLILDFDETKTPKTQFQRFSSLKDAKKWLTKKIDELYSQKKEKE